MTKLTLLVTVLVLAVPAAAIAADPTGPDRENAARYCKAQRTAIGADAFRTMYSPVGSVAAAFGRCASKFARAQVTHRSSAAKVCRTEQNDPDFAASHDSKTFTQFYGPGRNAFGNCVSSKARTSADAEQRATVRSAKDCKTERVGNAAAFKLKYGTGSQKANAFGRCVAGKLANP